MATSSNSVSSLNTFGTPKADILRITGSVVALHGYAGDDELYGASGDDYLVGGDGNDKLFGGNGADRLHGGNGDDFLDIGTNGRNSYKEIASGDAGNDLLVFRGDYHAYDGGTGVDWLLASDTHPNFSLGSHAKNIENARGTDARNVIFGNALANIIEGLGGNDELSGGGGSDDLNGGLGDDVLIGGSGSDRLTGGAGRDIFVLNSKNSADADQILDFEVGIDKIHLSAREFSGLGAANRSLKVGEFWSAAGAIKGHDTDDRIIIDTKTGNIFYDPDGSNAQYSAIKIASVSVSVAAQMTPSDFFVIA